MPRISPNTKSRISAVVILLASVLFFRIAYSSYQKQNIDLASLDKLTGIVEDCGTEYAGRKARPLVFFIKFRGQDQKLGVYRRGKRYFDLVEKVHRGEQLTAYFIKRKKPEPINIDLVQLERNGYVILDKKEYEAKSRPVIYLGCIVGVIFIVLGSFQYKYRW